MSMHFGLSEQKINQIVARLTPLTADLHVLFVKTLRCHWNIEDPRFLFLHEMLDDQYNHLVKDVDLVAERIRQLGRFVRASLREFQQDARLKDLLTNPTADEMLLSLAESYEELFQYLRADIDFTQDIGDPGTADMLTQLLRQYEKTNWFIRSHLSQGKGKK